MTINTRFKALLTLISIIGRMIPHPYNMTPSVTFATCSGQLLNRRQALGVALPGFLIADLLLAWLQHHAPFGYWSLFTYSALAAITYCAHHTREWQRQHQCLFVLGSSLGFWLWTNLGCWLTMPEYALSVSGFITCYTRALPFLASQLLGDALWYLGLLAALAQLPQTPVYRAQ